MLFFDVLEIGHNLVQDYGFYFARSTEAGWIEGERSLEFCFTLPKDGWCSKGSGVEWKGGQRNGIRNA
jgi:hypothetical protein